MITEGGMWGGRKGVLLCYLLIVLRDQSTLFQDVFSLSRRDCPSCLRPENQGYSRTPTGQLLPETDLPRVALLA